MTQFSLRPATAEDRELLYGIHREAMRPYVEQVWGWDEGFQRERFRRGFDPGTTQVVVSSGREIGFVRSEEREGIVVLAQVFVIPEYRGQGVGSALVRTILASGLPVKLRVMKSNTGARRLYERLGFRVVEESATHNHMLSQPGCRSR